MALVDKAVSFRLNSLKLEQSTDAYRVINSDGDSLSGLIVDKYNDVLYIAIHSLGIFTRIKDIIERMHLRLGTSRQIVRVSDEVAALEGIGADEIAAANLLPGGSTVTMTKITENGIVFQVNFEKGHKTGFFCDQRDNRKRFASLATKDTEVTSLLPLFFLSSSSVLQMPVALFIYISKDFLSQVLDLCSYTGGFALGARINGKATKVTALEADEYAVKQLRINASLNKGIKVTVAHEDVFRFVREMANRKRKYIFPSLSYQMLPFSFCCRFISVSLEHESIWCRWDLVLLDPPKLVTSRGDMANGRQRYEDMNREALAVVKDGGIFVTCSCSGLLSESGINLWLHCFY